MNPNPYAAPAQPYAPSPPPPPGAGQPGPLDASEAFSIAWDLFKRFGGPLVAATLVGGVIQTIPGQIPNILFALHATDKVTTIVLRVAAFLVVSVIGAYFHVGLVRMSIQAARGQQPSFGLLFAGGDRFGAMLGLYGITGLLVLVGCAALIVPGIFLGIALSFASFYLVDANLGPVKAIEASVAVVRVQWGQAFLFWLLYFLVATAGMLLCCVGYLASLPLAELAAAVAFVKISGRGALPLVQPPDAWTAPAA